MAIRTRQSVTGFIASDPQLTFTTQGDARFYARVGQEHYRRNDDGSFTKLDATFHDLVSYRRTAERAYAAFAKGDTFVAEGYVRTYEHEVDVPDRWCRLRLGAACRLRDVERTRAVSVYWSARCVGPDPP